MEIIANESDILHRHKEWLLYPQMTSGDIMDNNTPLRLTVCDSSYLARSLVHQNVCCNNLENTFIFSSTFPALYAPV